MSLDMMNTNEFISMVQSLETMITNNRIFFREDDINVGQVQDYLRIMKAIEDFHKSSKAVIVSKMIELGLDYIKTQDQVHPNISQKLHENASTLNCEVQRAVKKVAA